MSTGIREAAVVLGEKLASFHWFRMVGIGDDNLIVYVGPGTARTQIANIPAEWNGFPVSVRRMSSPKTICEDEDEAAQLI